MLCAEAIAAPLGCRPALFLKDAGLGSREEELDLADTAVQLVAAGLCALLGLAAVSTASGLSPTLLLEEELVLAREGERALAVGTGELHVRRESRTVILRLVSTSSPGLLCSLCDGLGLGICLFLRHILLDLGDPLVGACEKVLDLLRVFTHRDTAECIVAIGLGADEHLAVDKRHLDFV